MMKITALFLLCLSLSSCSTCRTSAIQTARSTPGAQIVTYKQDLRGMAIGAFVWTHHAEAVVQKDGAWWFLRDGQLKKEPQYRITGDLVLWDTEVYAEAVRTQQVPATGWRLMDEAELSHDKDKRSYWWMLLLLLI